MNCTACSGVEASRSRRASGLTRRAMSWALHTETSNRISRSSGCDLRRMSQNFIGDGETQDVGGSELQRRVNVADNDDLWDPGSDWALGVRGTGNGARCVHVRLNV